MQFLPKICSLCNRASQHRYNIDTTLFCNVVGTLHYNIVILSCENVADTSFSQRCIYIVCLLGKDFVCSFGWQGDVFPLDFIFMTYRPYLIMSFLMRDRT